jgi:hypothetical protein
MAVLGVFRRMDETPFKVLESGKVRLLKKGEIAFLDYEIYKDVWGFRFEGFLRKGMKRPEPTKQEITIKEVTSKEETLEDVRVEEVRVEEVKRENNTDSLIKELKKLDKKDFFVMKKDTCKEYLDQLEIDYSKIKDDKWSLVKFLQGILKEL